MIQFVYSIPYNLPHPPGFELKSLKIKVMARVIDQRGDAVCANYYRAYFEGYEKKRAAILLEKRKVRKFKPYYRTYTIYPTKDIEVPVEAVMGEIYYPQDQENRSYRGAPGCYIGCQDIRKSMEWVIAARLAGAMHVRLKYFFAFQCDDTQIARLTFRESWREFETQAETDEAFAALRDGGRRVDLTKMINHELLMKGKPGEITGCECYTPTPEEREKAYYESVRVRGRTRNKEVTRSVARVMSRKKTRYRGSWHARATNAAGISGAGTSEQPSNHDDDHESDPDADEEPEPPINADETDSEIDELFRIPEEEESDSEIDELFRIPDDAELSEHERLDEIGAHAVNSESTVQMNCYDFDYPEVGFGTLPAHQEPLPNRDTVREGASMLQAALLTYISSDTESSGSSSSSSSKSGSLSGRKRHHD